MTTEIPHHELDDLLQRCGASWDAAQTHGLLASRLAVDGVNGGLSWLHQVLEETDPANALATECRNRLNTLYQTTHRQLDERLSEFAPLLPGDDESPADRATALAHWCEGFLHGLVSSKYPDSLKKRLAAEPLSDIIRDMLQMTRATFDEDDKLEDSEAAYSELVEYVRVAAQLTYEELADLRHESDDGSSSLH